MDLNSALIDYWPRAGLVYLSSPQNWSLGHYDYKNLLTRTYYLDGFAIDSANALRHCPLTCQWGIFESKSVFRIVL